MHRFFVPPGALRGDVVTLLGTHARQIARVLRLRPRDTVLLLDNQGWQYPVELVRVAPERAEGRVLGREPAPAEPRVAITLYQGTLKATKFEWVLQKGTEVGVSAFVPVVCTRSVAREATDAPAKVSRWRRILQEAAEQAGRGRIPPLHPLLSFREAWDRVRGLSLLPWEDEQETGLRGVLTQRLPHDATSEYPPVNLFIGPEGGFTPEEADLARARGAVSVSLGRRILRAETAGVVAAAAVLYHVGELGG
ncbi:MAG: 16S rRNA (uracil(1498)-N(3))-methyltransferase [Chloroflexi bacterium]|nr:16S rRNA (uracil(1498)-N(3))-methyltransferase [Chloroflexota bacterium]